MGFLCGGILIFQGWRLDPILLLCQILSSGTAFFFIGESLWLRSINLEKKKMSNNLKRNQNIITKKLLNLENKKLSISTAYWYQEIKIFALSKNNNSWEAINYIGPLDY